MSLATFFMCMKEKVGEIAFLYQIFYLPLHSQ